MATGELVRRVGVAVVAIPVVVGSLYVGGWTLGVLVAAAAVLAAREFYALAEAGGLRPFTAVGSAASGALVLMAAARPTPQELGPLFLGLMVAVALLCLGGSVWLRWPGGGPLGSVSVTLAGVVYTGATLAFVPLLRHLPDTAPYGGAGNAWPSMGFVLLPLVTTWAGDSAGYFAGRAWGRAKLAPSVSPGKTVVGAVAGLAGSAAAALALAAGMLAAAPRLGLGLATAAWMGLVLGAAGQLGDLSESVLKREAGVKDSGRLLPGHGGVLDRVDSLLFAIPAAWGLLLLAGVLP